MLADSCKLEHSCIIYNLYPEMNGSPTSIHENGECNLR